MEQWKGKHYKLMSFLDPRNEMTNPGNVSLYEFILYSKLQLKIPSGIKISFRIQFN